MYRNILFTFCLVALIHSSLSDEEKTTEKPTEKEGEEGPEVKIDVLEKPEKECERFSVLGDILGVYYTGSLAKDGTVFDSLTREKSTEPFEFQLGGASIVLGWDDGLQDMCVGEKRKLNIPSDLGFGQYGSRDGKVGKDEDLVYEVELVTIKDGPKPTNVFKEIDADKDGLLSQDELKAYIDADDKLNGLEETLDPTANWDLVKAIFEIEDANRNGVITLKEFMNSKHPDVKSIKL